MTEATRAAAALVSSAWVCSSRSASASRRSTCAQEPRESCSARSLKRNLGGRSLELHICMHWSRGKGYPGP